MDCSLPASSVHGILQARILEKVPTPGDFPNPGIEPRSPALQAESLLSEPPGKPQYLTNDVKQSTVKILCNLKDKTDFKDIQGVGAYDPHLYLLG